MKMQTIYLDFNASTPVAPEVVDVMRQALETGHGNPSIRHWAGAPERAMVEAARAQVAQLLGCTSGEIVFTSGGSEANNHALKGIFFASDRKRPHFITSNAEHPAIVVPLRFLERLGAHVTWLPVDGTGLVDPDDLRQAITPDTVLVSIMHANNETGTIQPIADAKSRHPRPCRQDGDSNLRRDACVSPLLPEQRIGWISIRRLLEICRQSE